MNDRIKECPCFACLECEVESNNREVFGQCWVDNHTITVVDLIDSPPHYNKGKFEAIDVMEDWFFDDPLLFTALKYLARCKHKGNLVQDLEKAIWYIERRITKETENES